MSEDMYHPLEPDKESDVLDLNETSSELKLSDTMESSLDLLKDGSSKESKSTASLLELKKGSENSSENDGLNLNSEPINQAVQDQLDSACSGANVSKTHQFDKQFYYGDQETVKARSENFSKTTDKKEGGIQSEVSSCHGNDKKLPVLNAESQEGYTSATHSETKKQITTSNITSIDYKGQLDTALKKLSRVERQLDKANNYNDELRAELEKLNSELHKYRTSARNKVDVAIQVMESDLTTDCEMICGTSEENPVVIKEHDGGAGLHPKSDDNDNKPEESKSIADTLRETAEEAVAQSGYVYDENSGLYYDYNTGYYYNAEKGLYYDPRTGTYFYYDQQTGEYQFHSQVDLSYYTGHHHGNTDDSQQTTSRPQTNNTPDLRKKLSHKKKERIKGQKSQQQKEQGKRKHQQEKKDEKHAKKRKRRRKSRLEKWQEICQSKVKEIDKDSSVGNQIELCSSSNESQAVGNSTPGSSKDSCKEDVSMDDVYKDMPIFELSSENAGAQVASDENVSNNSTRIRVNPAGQGQSSDISNKSDSSRTQKVKLMNGDEIEQGELSSDYTSDSGEGESSSLCTGESELESGELTDSDSEESVIEVSDDSDDNDNIITQEEDLTISYPPCIRVIVTDSDCLDIGNLYIITVTGTAIGREAGQGILIPDINISKDHAFVGFDEDKKKYVIKDNGSQNGTFLNEERLSESKCVSDLKELNHGDTLQFGCTRLLLHIHMGTDTCDECEPGIIKANLESQQPKEIIILSKEEKKKQYKDQMKLIKMKYGLKNAAYVDNVSALKNPAYSDKAQERRKTVGSDNPYQPDEVPASVHRPISEKNVGHKLLKKLGWSEGESLGKDNSGIQEPVQANIRANQAAGLGSEVNRQRSLDDVADLSKAQRMLQTQLRFLQTEKKSKGQKSSNTVRFVPGPTQENT